MAEIDKSLPNEVKPLETEETQEDLEIITPGDTSTSGEGTEILENEDGSVDIDFDPSAMAAEESKNHYANLADFNG
jgi:hypothetical protein